MPSENRSELTGVLWFFSAITLVGLFVSAAIQGELTAAHIAFAFVVLVLAVAGSIYLLRTKENTPEQEKSKRQRIDSLLGDMSDEDLVELKRRLEAVDTPETPLTQYLGDDGELVRRQ
jgi:membrane protein implicated in regulation of membrane protease activity